MIEVIAAVDENWGIGLNNTLPWKCREDMEYFKVRTTNNTVVMGRRTWESIGKNLPNRTNIVLSNRGGYLNSSQFMTFNTFISHVYNKTDTKTFVIGGRQVYMQFLKADLVKYVSLTRIPGKHECDVFFPAGLMDNFLKFETIELSSSVKVERYVRKLF